MYQRKVRLADPAAGRERSGATASLDVAAANRFITHAIPDLTPEQREQLKQVRWCLCLHWCWGSRRDTVVAVSLGLALSMHGVLEDCWVCVGASRFHATMCHVPADRCSAGHAGDDSADRRQAAGEGAAAARGGRIWGRSISSGRWCSR